MNFLNSHIHVYIHFFFADGAQYDAMFLLLSIMQADYCCLNDQWPLQDIVAVFSRHYLHQNRAIEVFFSDRSSAFFAFESNREVKTAIRRLPKVGVGTAYDFAQTRFVRLLV